LRKHHLRKKFVDERPYDRAQIDAENAHDTGKGIGRWQGELEGSEKDSNDDTREQGENDYVNHDPTIQRVGSEVESTLWFFIGGMSDY
jgi:hypothetical protein